MPEAIHANEAMLKALASTPLPLPILFALFLGPPLLHVARRMRWLHMAGCMRWLHMAGCMRWLHTRSQQGLPEKGLQEQVCGRRRCGEAQAASEHRC